MLTWGLRTRAPTQGGPGWGSFLCSFLPVSRVRALGTAGCWPPIQWLRLNMKCHANIRRAASTISRRPQRFQGLWPLGLPCLSPASSPSCLCWMNLSVALSFPIRIQSCSGASRPPQLPSVPLLLLLPHPDQRPLGQLDRPGASSLSSGWWSRMAGDMWVSRAG